MISKKDIKDFIKAKKPVLDHVTKFGGQPNWITEPQWPISEGWDGRPMMFIGQIRLDEGIIDTKTPTMAYIFITHQESAEDDFFDPDIVEWQGGENAVIIQPGGTYTGETAPVNNGPTLFDKANKSCELLPRLENGSDPEFIGRKKYIKLTAQEQDAYFNAISGNKIGGTPNFIQDDFRFEGKWKLILQLNSSFLPFYLNLGAAPTIYVFVNNEGKKGGLLVHDT